MNIDFLKQIKEPIFFITNDVGRGIGLEKLLPNYHIVCLDDHPLVDYLLNQRVSVFCLEKVVGSKNIMTRNSGLILNHPLVMDFIKEKSCGKTPYIMVFKPQAKIERICNKEGFSLIINPMRLNDMFEDKLLFYELCKKHNLPTSLGEVGFLCDLKYKELLRKYGEKIVVQSGRGWAGNSTFFVDSEEDFRRLSATLKIKIKVTSYIEGKTCLNNAVVFGKMTFVSKPAIQIRANTLLTSNPGGTGGRQWPAGISWETEIEIKRITLLVGEMMRKEGYKGFFGLDFLVNKQGEVFVSECNARLTASTPFYTKIELQHDTFPLLAYHLLSFLPAGNETKNNYSAPVFNAGEIVCRNFSSEPLLITKRLDPGIYDYGLNLLKKTYFLDEKTENFWLSMADLGRKVNPEIEMIRIDSFGQICDAEGNLSQRFIELIKEARKIILSK